MSLQMDGSCPRHGCRDEVAAATRHEATRLVITANSHLRLIFRHVASNTIPQWTLGLILRGVIAPTFEKPPDWGLL